MKNGVLNLLHFQTHCRKLCMYARTIVRDYCNSDQVRNHHYMAVRIVTSDLC